MPNIFISYSHNDSTISQEISKALKNEGFSVFTDNNLLLSDNIQNTLQRSLIEAETVILLLSKNSKSSQWVRNEIASALDHGKKIIPVLLDDQAKNNWVWPLVSKHQAISFENDKSSVEDVVSKIVKGLGSGKNNSTEQSDESDMAAPKTRSVKNSVLKILGGLSLLLIAMYALTVVSPYSEKLLSTEIKSGIKIQPNGTIIIKGDSNRTTINADGDIVITPKK